MNVLKPVCPTCNRRHWEIVATETASRHVHMDTDRFRRLVKDGRGPARWAHDAYKFPRYHVNELDRWLAATAERAA